MRKFWNQWNVSINKFTLWNHSAIIGYAITVNCAVYGARFVKKEILNFIKTSKHFFLNRKQKNRCIAEFGVKWTGPVIKWNSSKKLNGNNLHKYQRIYEKQNKIKYNKYPEGYTIKVFNLIQFDSVEKLKMKVIYNWKQPSLMTTRRQLKERTTRQTSQRQ